jgi:hypothetical protein
MKISYLVTVRLCEYVVENVLVNSQNELASLIASLNPDEGQLILEISPLANLQSYGEFMETLSDLNKPDGLNFG